ncbi:type I-E CRISPR-associated protein Cse2/CasB [Nocardia colli]|uniref:Type I-E CRISPR-associated protein Cse2/CasB n=1 Tax=Nocardia colli TaxID=2545717 RepID=A0A5N0E0P7_9NOCA|nr:type I-E CRISPR-associated protein Cse2/CasB [Nocardia colli]KAA8881879.1 type I-E CRISPR-associated protein Cse2/CasB [Nocardia colli]
MNERRDVPGSHRFWHGAGEWVGGCPPHTALVTLRMAVGRQPGAVPALWPYYRTLDEAGRITDELWAEHITLGLFAIHQRSRRVPAHASGVEFATVLGRLRVHEVSSVGGLDRRFAAAVTSNSRAEVADHLRSLITRLHGVPRSSFDYDQLYRDLRDWERPGLVPDIRRRWGARFFTFERSISPPSAAATIDAPSGEPAGVPDQ